jgi:hypothetical protein
MSSAAFLRCFRHHEPRIGGVFDHRSARSGMPFGEEETWAPWHSWGIYDNVHCIDPGILPSKEELKWTREDTTL